MRKIVFGLLLIFSTINLYSQDPITIGMTGRQLRDALNSNFDTLFEGNFRDGIEIGRAANNARIDSLKINGTNISMYHNGTLLSTGGTFLNIKDYGAKGDGITNDAAALIAGIAAATDINGTLFCPSGTYYVPGLFNFAITRRNIRIVGDGNSILKGSNETFGNLTFTSVASASGTFTRTPTKGDIVIDATIYNSVNKGDILQISSTDPITNAGYFKGELVRVKRITGTHIMITTPLYDTYNTATTIIRNLNSGSVQIENMKFDSISVYLVNNKNIIVKNCEWINGNMLHLGTASALNVLIDNCLFMKDTSSVLSSNYCISIGGSQDVTVTNNKMYNSLQAIDAGGSIPSRNLLYENNVVSNFFQTTVAYTLATHANCEFIRIYNNTILNGTIAIGGTNTDIRNNVIRLSKGDDYSGWGLIRFYENAVAWVIPHHSMYDNIVGNEIIADSKYLDAAGIYIATTSLNDTINNLVISDNYIRTGGYGIIFSGASSISHNFKKITIRNNKIEQTLRISDAYVSYYAVIMARRNKVDYLNIEGNEFNCADGAAIGTNTDTTRHIRVVNNIFHRSESPLTYPVGYFGATSTDPLSSLEISNNYIEPGAYFECGYGSWHSVLLANNYVENSTYLFNSMNDPSHLIFNNNTYMTTSIGAYNVNTPSIVERNDMGNFSGALTDGAPTAAEINVSVGYTATQMLRGFKAIVKDTNGSGFTYTYLSDGANWVLQGVPIIAL